MSFRNDPQSQHQPSFIKPLRLKVPAYSDPAKHWNFHKAKWKHFHLLAGESVERLPPPDTTNIEKAYQNFARACYMQLNNISHVAVAWSMCHVGTKSARPSIFIRAPVGTDSDRASLSLLSWIEQKKQEHWEEAVSSIDFSHSSRKAWSTINNLTGRSGRSSHLCPISANSITSQLVKNQAHKNASHKSTNKKLSDPWKVQKPGGNSISGPFTPEELAAALRHLKPRKSPGLDFIFPELYSMPGWLSNLGFTISYFLHAPTQNSKDLENSTDSCNPEKSLQDPKSYCFDMGCRP